MGIEEGSITGHIQGLPVLKGESYLAQDQFTDDTGELTILRIEEISETSYKVTELPENIEYYLLKEVVITAPEDFNNNIHRFKLIEQL